jgi:Concanavalin A-like lectin/glucanases superfamily
MKLCPLLRTAHSALLAVSCLCLLPRSSHAQDANLDTDYQNYWVVPDLGAGPFEHYFDTNSPASTDVYGGSVLDNSTNANAVLPTDGRRFGLESSALGQTVQSVLADVAVGDVISPPPGFTTNLPPANFTPVIAGSGTNVSYYVSADGGAFYVASKEVVIAAQPNNVKIVWTNRFGLSRTQVINVSAVSTRRPSKLFWTERPYDAPVVDMSGLFPVIHYNSEVPPPIYEIVTTTNGSFVTTTTNVVSGVWLDGNKQLHAVNVDGIFLIEYYVTGNYEQQVPGIGVEVIRVQTPETQIVDADMGERLLPTDSYWADADGINGVIPDTSQSDTDTVLAYGQEGPKKNWAFPLRRTWMDPWSLEVYWKQTGVMGVQWPYEVDWYSVDWPDHPQVFVIGDDGATDQAPAIIPTDLTARILPDMDPPLSARLSDSGSSFTASKPGYSMLEYQNQTNIWFDVIHSVSHTNAAYFNLEPTEWEIGQELTRGDEQAHALALDGARDYVSIQDGYLDKQNIWSFSLWFNPDELKQSTLYSEGTDTEPAFNLNLTEAGQLEVEIWNQGGRTVFTTSSAPLRSNVWQCVAVTYTNANTATGTLSVYLDGHMESTNGVPRVSYDGDDRTLLGGRGVSPVDEFFKGRLDDLRVWTMALTSDQISSNRLNLVEPTEDSLIAWFQMDEGQGYILNNDAGDKRGAVMGNPTWTYGQFIPKEGWNGFPGYVHSAEGTHYNIDYYNYPDESNPNNESHVFAVNTGELEIWWANQSRNADMPAVFYPSRVVRYTNTWPSNPSRIVIASGLGSNGEQPAGSESWDPLQALEPSVYYQNDSSLDGYNPNEEHALLLDGVVYALRNDLNLTNTSEPYVLVDYTEASNSVPAMHVFQVLETNVDYQFERGLDAGLPIIPILPLGAFPPALSTFSDNTPPAWQDRKLEWWAVAAGNDGGTADTVMRFYYVMQPGFWFPSLSADDQPAIGTEVPWLSGSDTGTPNAFTYHISWPTNVAKLKLGQTLTAAQNGLPDIWDQLSVEIPYQQSNFQTTNDSVRLFDPLQAHSATLDRAVIDAMTSAGMARIDIASGLVRFPNLPPSLYPRLYYDKSISQLVLDGQRVETLTGAGYLLLNKLEPFEQSQLSAAAGGIDASLKSDWDNAVAGLPTGLTLIEPNTPYVKAALGARLSDGSGFVTLAFNNSTNFQQVPTASPISLSIIQVDTNLYSGELEVIQPPDVLAEQLSLRVSADLAGLASQCEFRWRWVDPVGGLPPSTDDIYNKWAAYGVDSAVGTNEVTISGASPFTLSDHYFAVQYRPIDTTGPSGTNWSDWTYNLAPGWVVRAMTGINPFRQTYQDMLNNAVDTRSTMISEAGGPYEGDIALNLDAANSAGLIPTYETIFHRAKEFSLLVGVADDDINQTLLFAASRLNDLYVLLGNEAFADAKDPTIPYPDKLSTLGANAASLFAFMNQEPNELEEELALLRGRDDTLEPSVQTSPVYNRLIWNFTQGINGGEAAYAYIYDIHGDPSNTDGTITAEDAKRQYPQGHGDAWGHYLSAIQHYYDLLSYTNFGWNTEPGATLVGNATVSVDYYDEQKFAQSAAALARTGADIVQQTFREKYSEDPTGRWPGYQDSDTNRAWGIAGWASRAGQSALYNWAAANSLMVTTLTNLTQINPQAGSRPPEGIEKIDRDSTPELPEIAAQYQQIQQPFGAQLN